MPRFVSQDRLGDVEDFRSVVDSLLLQMRKQENDLAERQRVLKSLSQLSGSVLVQVLSAVPELISPSGRITLCDLRRLFPNRERRQMMLRSVPMVITFLNYHDFFAQNDDARFARSIAFEEIDDQTDELIEAANMVSVRRNPAQQMRTNPVLRDVEDFESTLTPSLFARSTDLAAQAFRDLEDAYSFELLEFDVSDQAKRSGSSSFHAHDFLRAFGKEFMKRTKGIRVHRLVLEAFLQHASSFRLPGMKLLYSLNQLKYLQFLTSTAEIPEEFLAFLERVLKVFTDPEIHLSPRQMDYFQGSKLNTDSHRGRVKPLSLFHVQSLPERYR